jgi:hypothetical protein
MKALLIFFMAMLIIYSQDMHLQYKSSNPMMGDNYSNMYITKDVIVQISPRPNQMGVMDSAITVLLAGKKEILIYDVSSNTLSPIPEEKGLEQQRKMMGDFTFTPKSTDLVILGTKAKAMTMSSDNGMAPIIGTVYFGEIKNINNSLFEEFYQLTMKKSPINFQFKKNEILLKMEIEFGEGMSITNELVKIEKSINDKSLINLIKTAKMK